MLSEVTVCGVAIVCYMLFFLVYLPYVPISTQFDVALDQLMIIVSGCDVEVTESAFFS